MTPQRHTTTTTATATAASSEDMAAPLHHTPPRVPVPTSTPPVNISHCTDECQNWGSELFDFTFTYVLISAQLHVYRVTYSSGQVLQVQSPQQEESHEPEIDTANGGLANRRRGSDALGKVVQVGEDGAI